MAVMSALLAMVSGRCWLRYVNNYLGRDVPLRAAYTAVAAAT
jgi:hypothetical protein